MNRKTLLSALLLSLISSPSLAGPAFGLQIFGESGDDLTTVSGANIIFTSGSHYEDQLAYVGIGIANIEGVPDIKHDSQLQLLMGLRFPSRLSPYIEVGIHPMDLLSSYADSYDLEWDYHHHHHEQDRFNGYIGVGARFSVNSRLSLDLGYKYRSLLADDSYYPHEEYIDFGTATVSLNLGF